MGHNGPTIRTPGVHLSKRLAAIAVLSALAVVSAGGWGRLASRAAENPNGVDEIVIGDQKFSVPAAYLRSASGSGGVELVAFYPDFKPAGRTDDINALSDVDERFQRLVFLTLKPADPKIDPAERTARLYLRFLEETSWSHPGGLIARAFEPGSPFEGDELFYVAPEGRQFAARCRRPDPARKTPNTCIAAFRVGDIDIDMRFSANLLSDWDNLMQGARGLIESARR